MSPHGKWMMGLVLVAALAGCAGLPAGTLPGTAETGGLTIAPGTKLHDQYTPALLGFIDLEILASTGDTVTYSGRTAQLNQPVKVETNKMISRQNGVFWPSQDPNPVTRDIGDYAKETVTVKAGTFDCRMVPSADGTTKHWFAGPIVVKIANPLASMELVSLE